MSFFLMAVGWRCITTEDALILWYWILSESFISKHNPSFIVIIYTYKIYDMKGLLLIGIFMFCPVSILWGQDRIQQYAGTAMPYPVVKDSSGFFQDSMVPFMLTIWGDMERVFQLQERLWIEWRRFWNWLDEKIG